MANHKSAIKNIRSSKTKYLTNRYQIKTCRTLIKNFKKLTNKDEQTVMFREVSSALDKLARKNIIHRNKAANSKSKLFNLTVAR